MILSSFIELLFNDTEAMIVSTKKQKEKRLLMGWLRFCDSACLVLSFIIWWHRR
jgi:hypothetical protein